MLKTDEKSKKFKILESSCVLNIFFGFLRVPATSSEDRCILLNFVDPCNSYIFLK